MCAPVQAQIWLWCLHGQDAVRTERHDDAREGDIAGQHAVVLVLMASEFRDGGPGEPN
jgi:hypothetical protein